MGQQVRTLTAKIKDLEKDIVQHETQNFDLQEEARVVEDKLSEARDQRESVQRQYNL